MWLAAGSAWRTFLLLASIGPSCSTIALVAKCVREWNSAGFNWPIFKRMATLDE